MASTVQSPDSEASRHWEWQYLDLMARIWASGDERSDRTGVGTRSVFGAQMRFDLADGAMPLLTTKRVYWKTATREMLWFLTGDTNIRPLCAQNVQIWTDWPLDRYRRETGVDISREDFSARIVEDAAFAEQWGDLGPVYGKQWVDWPTYEPAGDGLYRMAPIRAASGCGQAEGSHGVHWSASVAEKPRTGLASNAKCLMPLQGINVFRGHKIHLPILQSPLAEFGGKHTQPQHHYAAPGYVMLDGWPSRRWTCLPSLSREPTLPAEFFQLIDFRRGTRKPAMLFLLLLPNSKRSPRRHSKTAKYP